MLPNGEDSYTVNDLFMFGDRNGDYFKAEVDLQGENTIAFELYSQDELGGEILDSMSIDF